MADQNVRLLHREREVVVRVDSRKRVLLLRRDDIFVQRFERQALEKVPIILDAGIRASRKPNLGFESATEPCYPMPRYLNYTTMQAAVSEAAAMQIVPVAPLIRVVIAMYVPDLGKAKDRTQDRVEWQAALKVAKEDHSLRTMNLHQPDDVIEKSMYVAKKPNHS
ncbi:hypothetical protein PMI38_00900 [Pseudomonas sp. GM84]|nr:hypothetical protein PMI38_00900 [Pseudomonas sp. GM84]